MIGGKATLGWSFGGQSGSFSFCINGNGSNPAASDLRAALGSNPWYLFQIAEQESGAKQFTGGAAYAPVFGPPSGYGLMQIDPPTSELDVFSWLQNAADGVTKAQAGQSVAVTRWNQSVKAYNTYVQQNPSTAPPPPANDQELNCGTFVYGTPGAGQHSFEDAIGIKRYNGLGSSALDPVNGHNYIAWYQTGAYQMNPQWVTYNYTVLSAGPKTPNSYPCQSNPQKLCYNDYYVKDVCGQNP
jgi:hypothetical protein